ncbi:MAG: tyrosine-type recombinase/integrase [Bryobacterales bacterium]|nr:tyrosine-type recombinase/integrase [Bryobacterales bacterium]
MKLSDACDAYLRDMEARNFRRSTLKNYKSLFRALQSYARDHGLTDLTRIDQAEMRAWRESWSCKPGTQRLRLGQLRAFFTYAIDVGWVQISPMLKLKAPRSSVRPRMPLTRNEVASLVNTAEDSGRTKEKALILLMRYSGLSIRDAVTLRSDAIDGNNNLTLRRAKSGELVMLPLHSLAIEALERIYQAGQTHFFWSGKSLPITATKYWRDRLQLVASKAGVQNFTPHRLRHTFAVEFLLAGKSMEDLSTLLGHSSVITTERHYAQWDVSRRDRLSQIVREVHACDPLPELLNGRMSRKTTRGPLTRPPKSAPAPLPVMRSSSSR